MWINTRHKVFAYVLFYGAVIGAGEFVFDGLSWWQRVLFVYVPAAFLFDRFLRYMGWWNDAPDGSDGSDAVDPVYHDWTAPTSSTQPPRA